MKNPSDLCHNQFDSARIFSETGVARLEVSESLPSTNDVAKALAKRAGQDELPLLVLTRIQTQGRGQGDHHWYAGAGSLTFSLAIDQQAIVDSRGLISAAVAVAVCEAIEATTGLANVQIKWPNDILIKARKVAGILVESVISSFDSFAPRLVIGIGINVNHSIEYTDPGSLLPPVSLVELIDRQTNLTDLLIATVQSVKSGLNDPGSSLERYNERSFVNGKRISIMLPNSTKIVHGIAVGLENDGGLLISPLDASGQLSALMTVVSGRICQIECEPGTP